MACEKRSAGVPRTALAARAAGLRPRAGSDDVTYATKLAMRTLGRRVLAIEADNTELDTLLGDLVETTAAGAARRARGRCRHRRHPARGRG